MAKSRKPENVASDIAALLIESGKDEQIDTGRAVDLLADALFSLRSAIRLAKKTRVVFVDVRGGVVQDTTAPHGVKVIIRDWGNCDECGGVDCMGGHARESVHGPDEEREARRRNR